MRCGYAISLVFLFVLNVSVSLAQELATLYSAQGGVQSKLAAAHSWRNASIGSAYEIGDALKTAAKSRAGVLFTDGVLVQLNEQTILEFKDALKEITGWRVFLNSGSAYFFGRNKKGKSVVETPAVSAAIRGTEFSVEASHDRTVISVIDGQVDCSNQYGSVHLNSGEQAVTVRGQAPVKAILVRPLDAVQWALYYPAVLDLDDFADVLAGASPSQKIGFDALSSGEVVNQEAFSSMSAPDVLVRSVVAYRQGKFEEAFEHLKKTPAKPAGLLLYEASLNLSVGQVKEAEALLSSAKDVIGEALESTRPALLSAYYAQSAIVALVNNRKEEARELALKAVSEKESASSALTMSYIEQAYFDLEHAKRWLKKAAAMRPKSGMVLARLAEIELGFAAVDKALELAAEAHRLSPGDSYPLTILGFAHLTRFETEKAKTNFRLAIGIDPARGLPHMGLGLALIREGMLEAGAKEIEKAAHLEANSAIYRSYLGKVFFELEEESIAAHEYERAIDLDPNDPTPYLYRAFHRLSSYQPIEALLDIDRSILLNENRAVYRSTLLLDQDLAVRSAGLGRVFSTLGFNEAARVEALKSLNRDYANYSAHLLLADAYDTIPGQELAFVSEKILARLLVPVNFNVISPSGGGGVSLNEYTSLFDRPQNRYLLKGGGSTLDEAIESDNQFAGSSGRFGYSARYAASHSNGFRDNDYSRDHIIRLDGEYQLSHRDKVLAFVAVADDEEGDTSIGFNPKENEADKERSQESSLVNIGYTHSFAPNSTFVSLLAYNHDRPEINEAEAMRLIALTILQGGDIAELQSLANVRAQFRQKFEGLRFSAQHIWNSPLLSLVTGGEILDASVEQDDFSTLISDELDFFSPGSIPSSGEHSEDSEKAFVYGTLHFAERVDVNIGGNFTRLKIGRSNPIPPFIDGEDSEGEWNPKLGVSIYPHPQITLRGAYFETVGIAGLSDLQSIEPTFVGGFSQSFDDFPGSKAKNYGVGVDIKYDTYTYAGMEFSRRKNKTPLNIVYDHVVLDVDALTLDLEFLRELETIDSRRDVIKGYLYNILSRTVSSTLDYSFADSTGGLSEIESKTHKVGAGLNYFNPSGWFAFTSATWREQRVKGLSAEDKGNGTNDFWILSLGAGYQLPRRHGTVSAALINVLEQDFLYEPTDLEEVVLPDISATIKYSINF